jgi:hypothetical protein
MCRDFIGFDQSKVYGEGGTTSKGSVILAVFSEIGITAEVNFQGMNDMVPPAGERRDETPFRYLARKSQEWHAIFRIGHSADGILCGLFIDPSQISTSPTIKLLTGGKNSFSLKYASGEDANVISYTWGTNDGENGAGDNVRIEQVNGQYQFVRFSMDSETVVTWVLNEDAVQQAMKDAGTIDRQWFLTQQVLSANKFADVQKYFRAIETSTAPNGYGYVVKAKLFGAIFAVPPVGVTFDSGFPPCLTTYSAANLGAVPTAKTNTFYIRAADHSISRAGYFTEVEVVDCFVMYGQVGLQ